MSTNDDNMVVPINWEETDSRIKVIGVGGGGCNAVTYMYNQKIRGCTFIVCNTDNQALMKSTVPTKIVIGDGKGAGTNPEKARKAALESQDIIKSYLVSKNTDIVFVTACLGGGTGTGAAPVIAKLVKDSGILTIGVVSLPFENEGRRAMSKAADGIHELKNNVDSLLIINNQKLFSYFGKERLLDAMPKANEVLSTAVKGIIEIINKCGEINVDIEDVKTMMKNSGMALMGSGKAKGSDRVEEAVKQALESPLLNDFDLSTAKNLLINVTTTVGEKGIYMEDFGKITELVTERTGLVDNCKQGLIIRDDPNADDSLQLTVIATGFKADIAHLVGTDYSNIIVIGDDYTYNPEKRIIPPMDEADMTPAINKVGFNSTENVPHFHFDKKPVLDITGDEDISPMLTTPSIRRVAHLPVSKES